MTKEELRQIAEDLIDELRKLPDGAEITSAELLKHGGYEPSEFSEEDLLEYHARLFRAAKANKITLDMSKHDGLIEGLPYNLDFVVHNKKAQFKCPHCGSTDTAAILYGMPEFSEELRKELESGKLYLGGCCIGFFEIESGEHLFAEPERYCNHCRKEFGRPPYLVAKDGRRGEAYRNIVTGIRFTDGGYFMGEKIVEIRRTKEGALVEASDYRKLPIPDREITPDRWYRLVDRLYNDLHLHEWKKNYKDISVLDGEEWELEITLTNRRKRTYRGSNAFPPYWKELKALFRPFFRRN